MDQMQLIPDNSFAMTPDIGSECEPVLLAILHGVTAQSGRRKWGPLLCVTFKQPLDEYKRVIDVCNRWKLSKTDLYRIYMELALPALESPTGELRHMLEQHRENEIEKARLRKLSDEKRKAEFAV